MPDIQDNLTGGRRLAHNVLWNLLGTGLPLLVAIIAIPMLIEKLGKERFGVLTLVWMVVGYFSLFDLGLGRALTKLVAEYLGNERKTEIPSLIGTAIFLMAALGLLGAAFVAIFSPWLVSDILKILPAFREETLLAFYLLAASVPIVIVTTGMRGILEAYQYFGLVNAVRIPLGIFTFLGPMLVLPFSNNLTPVVAVLVLARLVSGFVYVVLCLHVDPSLRYSISIKWTKLSPLIRFGGWMTVTNVVSPLMAYSDRFFIGAMVSMAAVTYYATPYEVVTKLTIIPGALMGVMFPAFAAAFVQNRAHAIHLYNQSVNFIFLSLFPIALIFITFSHEGLTLWLGSEFSENSSMVLQLLVIGVFINSLANIPFGMVQGAGRPDLSAKLHMIELPLYLLILWFLLDKYGIVGAAFAWVLRMVIDAIICFVIAQRLLSEGSPFKFRAVLITSAALVILSTGIVIQGIVMKGFFLVLVLLLYVKVSWVIILDAEMRQLICRRLKTLPLFNLFKSRA